VNKISTVSNLEQLFTAVRSDNKLFVLTTAPSTLPSLKLSIKVADTVEPPMREPTPHLPTRLPGRTRMAITESDTISHFERKYSGFEHCTGMKGMSDMRYREH
jgi:hypothetical protein